MTLNFKKMTKKLVTDSGDGNPQIDERHHSSDMTPTLCRLLTLLALVGVMLATVQAQTSQGQGVQFADTTITVGGVSFKMIAVEGGTFTMGATDEQGIDAHKNEKPSHSVTLSSYLIGETEVTQALWKAVMRSNPSEFRGANQPVEQVSWSDCETFIRKLNKKTGMNFRLPTEAEWEFAARGGNRSKGYKFAGSNRLSDVAWYWQNSGDRYLPGTDDDYDGNVISCNYCHPHEVAQKSPNELGLYDMSGNVWEWCQDWYGYYDSSAQTNPTGPSRGPYCVYRGGGCESGISGCRVSTRYFYTPNDYGSSLHLTFSGFGLRLAASAPVR